MAHQLTTLRGTLQNTRSDRTRVVAQLSEEMTRLRAAFEAREADLRQLRISEREAKEEIGRLRKALEHQKSLTRKKLTVSINSGGPSGLTGRGPCSVTPSRLRKENSSGHLRPAAFIDMSPKSQSFADRSYTFVDRQIPLDSPDPVLPLLSPETLHRRSAFIISRSNYDDPKSFFSPRKEKPDLEMLMDYTTNNIEENLLSDPVSPYLETFHRQPQLQTLKDQLHCPPQQPLTIEPQEQNPQAGLPIQGFPPKKQLNVMSLFHKISEFTSRNSS